MCLFFRVFCSAWEKIGNNSLDLVLSPFLKISVGFSCCYPTSSRSCVGIITFGERKEKSGGSPRFPTKRKQVITSFTHSQLLAIPFVVFLFIYLLFSFSSSFFLSSFFPQELWLSGKDFPVTICDGGECGEILEGGYRKCVLFQPTITPPFLLLIWVSRYSVFCRIISHSPSIRFPPPSLPSWVGFSPFEWHQVTWNCCCCTRRIAI